MNSAIIRQKFMDYFEAHGHKIVSSAPIVIKNDPTLMFTNAGMNQFKDYFLGNKQAEVKRIANTQKCLRVSGKHNDLEEVGVDTYHHTMFEMLGNWSFGDYFKEDAIAWAWEVLTEVFELDKDRIYVTVFEGAEEDNLAFDTESYNIWKKFIAEERILKGNKKDNFWEMGETGPCGPCSEIHFDLRPESERLKLAGSTLVNNDHPQVIEIWNLVFMQFNRKSGGKLENLPNQHVDTGMGFERLVRAVHGKHSNYDTDIFMDSIQELEKLSGLSFPAEAGPNKEKIDIAFRVVADHIRALSFAIADGQLPSNTGAGYVIRRILRRAVRYSFSYLGQKEASIYKLVKPLAEKFKTVFPELYSQKDFVEKVIMEEEKSFLSTLSKGLEILNQLFKTESNHILSGGNVFELYDTFGFPIDLTKLIASENGFKVDEEGFREALEVQKNRSKKNAEKTTGDWTILGDEIEQTYVGYDLLNTSVKIKRHRLVTIKDKKIIQAVFDFTPFYAESGGQVGDTGYLRGENNAETIKVLNTIKENNLSVHILEKLPENLEQSFTAQVDINRHQSISKNHSATHLLHSALRNVLGPHIAQKGSLVDSSKLRFDFSHFSKISDEELHAISEMVNQKITENIALEVFTDVPIDEAIKMGATALFGEKYSDLVRVIAFDRKYSMELCGGTHVNNTSEIKRLILTSETAVAAGVRRIEAITGAEAEKHINQKLELLETSKELLGQPKDFLQSLQQLITENHALKKSVEGFQNQQTQLLKKELKSKITEINAYQNIIEKVIVSNTDQIKDLCFQLKNENPSLFICLATQIDDKPFLAVAIGDALLKSTQWNAGKIIRNLAKEINGGGGGQDFFATAGGKKTDGIDMALQIAKSTLI